MKNFIYEFWVEVDDNPARQHLQPGDRHYQCRHVKPGERPKIVTLTKKGNGSVNGESSCFDLAGYNVACSIVVFVLGLVRYLEHHWPHLHQLYETMRKHHPQPKPTVQELRITHGEVAADDAAVEEYFEALKKKGEELLDLLGSVR